MFPGYKNQLKVTFNHTQMSQIRALTYIHGMSMQDVIRKALDRYAIAENERILKTNVHAKPLPGF